MCVHDKIHASITRSRVLEAIERYECLLGNPGLCLACGEEAEGCEPNARNYTCEFCECDQVFGASEIFLMDAYHADNSNNEKDKT